MSLRREKIEILHWLEITSALTAARWRETRPGANPRTQRVSAVHIYIALQEFLTGAQALGQIVEETGSEKRLAPHSKRQQTASQTHICSWRVHTSTRLTAVTSSAYRSFYMSSHVSKFAAPLLWHWKLFFFCFFFLSEPSTAAHEVKCLNLPTRKPKRLILSSFRTMTLMQQSIFTR